MRDTLRHRHPQQAAAARASEPPCYDMGTIGGLTSWSRLDVDILPIRITRTEYYVSAVRCPGRTQTAKKSRPRGVTRQISQIRTRAETSAGLRGREPTSPHPTVPRPRRPDQVSRPPDGLGREDAIRAAIQARSSTTPRPRLRSASDRQITRSARGLHAHYPGDRHPVPGRA